MSQLPALRQEKALGEKQRQRHPNRALTEAQCGAVAGGGDGQYGG
jgi:hypothetical protein